MPNEEKVENEGKEIGEIEKKMDELLEQNQSKGAEEDVQNKDSKDEGWITSLPKELRDGVDPKKYSSLSEYIKDLREHQEKVDDDVTKEKVEEEWTSFSGKRRRMFRMGSMLPCTTRLWKNSRRTE